MSIGNKLGRAIGITGALALHAAERTVAGAGTFGTDLVAGVEAGYADKRAFLAQPAEVRKAQREAAIAEMRNKRAPIAAPVKPARAKA